MQGFSLINDAVLQICLVIVATMLVDTLHRVSVRRILGKIEVKREKHVWLRSVIVSFKTPFSLTIYIGALGLIAKSMSNVVDWTILSSVPQLRTIAILIICLYFGLRFVFELKRGISKVASANNRKLDKEDPEFLSKYIDVSTIEAGSRIASVLIITLFTLMFLHEIGVSLEAIVAFGGFGGLAVGFAAKDLLANFFGGLMINLDKPFTVGDWILSPDSDIEGVVEELGWRMTTIRRFDKQPLYVMNSQFATISVQNPSRMTHRRIWERISIRYEDIEKLKAVIHKIKLMIEGHSGIAPEETLMVNFDKYGSHGAEVFVYCFTRTTDWGRYHQIKQDVLFKIAEIVKEEGAEIAIPVTRTKLESRGITCTPDARTMTLFDDLATDSENE